MTQLGLKENWKQFFLLVLINAFVGGMVGMERSIFPEYASLRFEVGSNSAMLSFIIAFGLSKALANYYTGRLANTMGRRNLLVYGWLLAIPVPLILIYANSWSWVVMANVLLGISQGLTWSSTVVMKIDLVGEKDRGLAMGLNEFAGYFAVGLVAFLTAYLANRFGVSPYPFYLGLGIAITGLVLSVLFVKDTRAHVRQEQTGQVVEEMEAVFLGTTFSNKTLSSVTQAGLVNNLNDGMIWGLLPILLLSQDFNVEKVGWITGIYPTLFVCARVPYPFATLHDLEGIRIVPWDNYTSQSHIDITFFLF